MGQKHVFLEVIEKIGHEFLLSLYYFVCSCTNPILQKILVSEIWAKVFYRQSLWRNFSLTMFLEMIYGIDLDNQVSLNFGMVVGSLIKLWITQLDFIEKIFGCKNLGDVQKTGISEFIENFGG